MIKFDSTLSDEMILQEDHLVEKLKDSGIDIDIELAGKKVHRTSQIAVTEDLELVYI